MTTIEKAKALEGKSFNYKGKSINISSVIALSEYQTQVITDQEDFEFTLPQLATFVQNCHPLKEEVVSTNEQTPSVIDTLSNMAKKMSQVLFDDIEKIEKDSNYIPQAKARKENVDSMIELMKVGVQLSKSDK